MHSTSFASPSFFFKALITRNLWTDGAGVAMTSTAAADNAPPVSAASLVKPHRSKGKKRTFGSDFDFDTATLSGRGMRSKVPILKFVPDQPTFASPEPQNKPPSKKSPRTEQIENKQMAKAQLKVAEQVRSHCWIK